jgi:hypothetical protein
LPDAKNPASGFSGDKPVWLFPAMLRWILKVLGRVAFSHAPGDTRLFRLAWREKSCARAA